MALYTKIMFLLSGVVLGVVFVVSCGPSVSHVDAADSACNCPASEPPLAGRVVTYTDTRTIKANSTGFTEALCPAVGAQLVHGVVVSGGCEPSGSLIPNNLTLVGTGAPATEGGWHCSWNNQSATDVAITTYVRCLNPAS
jgi:hypothetical protein